MARLTAGRESGSGAPPATRSALRPPYPVPVDVPPGYPGLGWREDLAGVVARQKQLRAREEAIVAQALAAGVTMSAIAKALGRSRQAVAQRYGRLRPKVVAPQ